MSIFRMLINYSKWVIDDTILDRFSSIAIPRRRFFGCSSITHFKKSASRGFEPTRDFDGLFTGLSRWWVPLRHRRGCGLRVSASRWFATGRVAVLFSALRAASGSSTLRTTSDTIDYTTHYLKIEASSTTRRPTSRSWQKHGPSPEPPRVASLALSLHRVGPDVHRGAVLPRRCTSI